MTYSRFFDVVIDDVKCEIAESLTSEQECYWEPKHYKPKEKDWE